MGGKQRNEEGRDENQIVSFVSRALDFALFSQTGPLLDRGNRLTLVDLLPTSLQPNLVPEHLPVLPFLPNLHRQNVSLLDELLESLLGSSPRFSKRFDRDSSRFVLVELDGREERGWSRDLMVGLAERVRVR